MMKKPELLAPAGNLEKLKFAIVYGADAVYLGGEAFGLRAGAGNFSFDDMAEGIAFAHERGRKVYVTVNIFAHNKDLAALPDYLRKVAELGADAILVSDPGVFQIAREVVPNLSIHISTQANNTNWQTAMFWQKLGAERIVLARELSLAEVGEITETCRKSGMETEMFVHGAMCISYSGRCLLSNFMVGRDANQGDCAHACRWRYRIQEEKRDGEYMEIEEDGRGAYIMNSKDLCLLPHLPEIIAAGVDSLKIEGRMKSPYYVANTVRIYRAAIDAYCAAPESYQCDPAWQEELTKVSHRDYTDGFALGKPKADAHRYEDGGYLRNYSFVGLVRGQDEEYIWVEQRHKICLEDTLEMITPTGEVYEWQVKGLVDKDKNSIESTPHAQMLYGIPWQGSIPAWSILRQKEIK